MAKVLGHGKEGTRLVDALGLPPLCRWFQLTVHYDECIRVRSEHFVNDGKVIELARELEQLNGEYRWVESEIGKEL